MCKGLLNRKAESEAEGCKGLYLEKGSKPSEKPSRPPPSLVEHKQPVVTAARASVVLQLAALHPQLSNGNGFLPLLYATLLFPPWGLWTSGSLCLKCFLLSHSPLLVPFILQIVAPIPPPQGSFPEALYQDMLPQQHIPAPWISLLARIPPGYQTYCFLPVFPRSLPAPWTALLATEFPALQYTFRMLNLVEWII